METFYSPEDLLFFLYVRSILEKPLGKGYFHKRWNDLGPGREKLHESTWIPHHISVQVCRAAFGNDKDSLKVYNECLDLVFKYSEPMGSGEQAPRRIRVIHLLQLMLDQYHRSRPAQNDADTTAFLESQDLVASDTNGERRAPRIESKDEQDRLFREAQRHFEEFAANSGSNSDDGAKDSTYLQRAQEERQARIKALEDRIRAEIASKRNPNQADTVQDDRAIQDSSPDHQVESHSHPYVSNLPTNVNVSIDIEMMLTYSLLLFRACT